MKKRILSCLLLTSVLITTIFTGCGADGGKTPEGSSSVEVTEDSGKTSDSASEDSASDSGEADGAGYRDTIRVALNGDQDNLDPQNNRSNNIVLSQIYSRLVRRDMNNELVPDLAESWEVSEDELTWTFHLRQGVKFHNGKDFTSRDVKASIDRTIDKENTVNTTEAMGIIREAVIVDEYTVQLITEKPVGPFLQTLAGNLGGMMMCADVIEQYGTDIGYDPETVVGTGPYKLVEWNKEENMTLEAYDGYWEGVPQIKNIEFKAIADDNARSIALETDQVDLMFRVPPSEVGRLNSVDGVHVETKDAMGLHLFLFNMSRPILEDPRIRQAIIASVDMETMVSTLFSELGETTATAPCSPLYFGYKDMGVQPYDVELAKELLADAGYPDGIEISIMTCGIYNNGIEMAEVMKEMMADAGITLNIEVMEQAAFSAAMASRNPDDQPWDMWIMGLGNMALDYTELRNFFRSTVEGTDRPNGSYYANEELDELTDKALYTTDEKTRMECYERVAELVWWEDPAAIWANYRTNVFGLNDRVRNFEANVANEVNFWQMTVLEQ